MLTDEQVERYSRQIVLPEIGGSGQERLLTSSIAVLGGGPLAGQVVSYLARAGIGRILLSSTEADVRPTGAPDCATEQIIGRNSEQAGCDILIDATGARSSVLASNQIARRWQCPLIWTKAYKNGAAVAVFAAHCTTVPCMECAIEGLSLQEDELGSVLTPVSTAWAAGYCAAEALRCLVDAAARPGSLTTIDASTSLITVVALAKVRGCTCGF